MEELFFLTDYSKIMSSCSYVCHTIIITEPIATLLHFNLKQSKHNLYPDILTPSENVMYAFSAIHKHRGSINRYNMVSI